MNEKMPNLTLRLPRCRHCNRYWRPSQGVLATRSFCDNCSESRQKTSAALFNL